MIQAKNACLGGPQSSDNQWSNEKNSGYEAPPISTQVLYTGLRCHVYLCLSSSTEAIPSLKSTENDFSLQQCVRILELTSSKLFTGVSETTISSVHLTRHSSVLENKGFRDLSIIHIFLQRSLVSTIHKKAWTGLETSSFPIGISFLPKAGKIRVAILPSIYLCLALSVSFKHLFHHFCWAHAQHTVGDAKNMKYTCHGLSCSRCYLKH